MVFGWNWNITDFENVTYFRNEWEKVDAEHKIIVACQKLIFQNGNSLRGGQIFIVYFGGNFRNMVAERLETCNYIWFADTSISINQDIHVQILSNNLRF